MVYCMHGLILFSAILILYINVCTCTVHGVAIGPYTCSFAENQWREGAVFFNAFSLLRKLKALDASSIK